MTRDWRARLFESQTRSIESLSHTNVLFSVFLHLTPFHTPPLRRMSRSIACVRCVELVHCRVAEVPDTESLVNGFDVIDCAKEAATDNAEKIRTRFCAHSREVGCGTRAMWSRQGMRRPRSFDTLAILYSTYLLSVDSVSYFPWCIANIMFSITRPLA